MTTTTTDTKRHLIKVYHILAGKLKMTDDDRKAFLSAWDVESSKDLTVKQLQEACKLLKGRIDGDMDKWRKRVMGAIYGYLELTGRKTNDAGYVKSIACRSAKYDSFNSIPRERLSNLYNTFLNKQKDLKRTGKMIDEDLEVLSFKN